MGITHKKDLRDGDAVWASYAVPKILGRRKAEKVWLASRDAVNELRTRTHRLGIAAHFTTRPSSYLAGNVLDANGLRRDLPPAICAKPSGRARTFMRRTMSLTLIATGAERPC